jgi:hypothetical protein
MEAGDQFEAYVRLALGRYGIPVDEVDLAVIQAAERVYGPLRDALLAADLSGIEPEHGLDPSRPPVSPAAS